MNDPVIERIREARHQISEEHTHDPERVVAYYIELQKRYSQRLVELSQIEEDGADRAPGRVALTRRALSSRSFGVPLADSLPVSSSLPTAHPNTCRSASARPAR